MIVSAKVLDNICIEIKERWDVLHNISEQINSLNNISVECYLIKNHPQWFSRVRSHLALTMTDFIREFMLLIDQMREVIFSSYQLKHSYWF